MLPANPILASLTIIGWLIFRPSQWKHYVTTINSELLPDFALIQLRKTHWRQAPLRRLLLLGHGLLSISASLIVTLFILVWWGFDIERLILTSCYTLSLSIVGGLLGSLVVSVAFGIMIGFVGGILLSLPVGMAGDLVFSMTENIAVLALAYKKYDENASFLEILPILSVLSANIYAQSTILLGIFSAGQAGSIMNSTTVPPHIYPSRQAGSIVIGVLVSAVVIAASVLLTGILALSVSELLGEIGTLFTLAMDGITATLFGLAFAVVWFWYKRHLKQTLLIGLSVIFLFELLTILKNSFQYSESLSETLLNSIHGGVENGLLFGFLFVFPYILAKSIADAWSGIVAGIFTSAGIYIAFNIITTHSIELSLTALLVFILSLSVVWWQPIIFYPLTAGWNLLIQRADEKRKGETDSLYHWHSAFWDEHQYIRLQGLEEYVVTIAERNPEEGKKFIEHLTNTRYQRWAARDAQIELDARKLQSCRSVLDISNAYRTLSVSESSAQRTPEAGELISSVDALLRSFSRYSRDVNAALAQESHYNQRLALDAIEERLDGLLRELVRSSETYALKFRPIAANWRQIIANHAQNLTETVENQQEINNPYVIGIPLTEHQEIFVGRSDVSEHIEKLLLDYRRPPLLLYGQRRTGKTSLLNNLGRLLPTTIIPLFVDLQGSPSSAKDDEKFLYNVGRAMLASAKRHREMTLPPLTHEKLQADPFAGFDEWLDELEDALDAQQTMLLTLDEFGVLESAFTKGFLDKDFVLGMFRHIIQHRPRLKVLLSGSHAIDEFEQWASYLINVQTIHISYLRHEEALQLIERPIKDFTLRYEPTACQRIVEISHCHPALIQLMCSEIVTLKNKQPITERRLVHLDDVEAAVPGALQHGRFFFADIANNQVTKTGLTILRFLAAQGEKSLVTKEELRARFPEEFELSISNLLQRELIEPVENSYRFQVELIRRWFI